MTPEELESAVLAGDLDRTVRLLTDASEGERLACGTQMARLRKAHGDWPYAGRDPTNAATLLGLLGTGTAAQIAGGRRMWRHERAEAVLRLRPDALLVDLVPWLRDHMGWRFVRSLVREGRIARPVGDAYILGMLDSQVDADVLLRDDPGLLDHEVWRLFEVEGTADHSLADHDKYTADAKGWQHALLIRAGAALDRDRLLDASLAALERDFPQFRAGWYSRFHEALAPTPSERSARVGTYLRLLRSPIGPTVTLAVGALGDVQAAGALDGSRLIAHIEPAVVARSAGAAKGALQLVEGVVRRDPGLGPAAGQAALAALGHSSADVQRAAIALFSSGLIPVDEVVASRLAQRRTEVAASLRPAFDALIAQPAAPAEAAISRANAATTSPTARDPWATLEPVQPPETLEALVELLAAVLERQGPPEDLELALDGLLRFPREASPAFQRATQAIRVRAGRLVKANRGPGVARWFAGLVVAWVDGMPPEQPPDRGRLADALARRVHEVARAAADGRRGRLLARPSFAGGWIEPAELVARLADEARDGEPPLDLPLDLPQALLRLLPIRREPALAAAASLGGEAGEAVRHALGGVAPIGPTAPLWAAAARCRAPAGDDTDVDRVHAGLGPDAALAGRYSFVIAQGRFMRVPALEPGMPAGDPHLDVPSGLLWRVTAHASVGDDGPLIDWARLIWPQDRRSWFAVSAALLLWNLDWWEARWHDRRRLEPLFEPWTAIGPDAAALLAVTLQAKEPGQRGLAVDAAVALVDHDRIQPDAVVAAFDAVATALEPQLPEGFTVTLFRPGRLASSLEEVARRSDRHAAWALEVASGALARMTAATKPAPVPVGQLTPLLRLLVELTAALQESIPPIGRPPLESIATGSGVGAGIAQTLLRRPSPS